MFRYLLDALALISGIFTLVVITGHIRSKFWKRHDAVVLGRSLRDYWTGAGLALVCGVLWSASYVTLKHVSNHAAQLNVDAAVLHLNVAVLGWAVVFLFLGSLIARRREAATGLKPQAPPSWRSTRGTVAILANMANFGLAIYALNFISATQAMTLNNMSPLFVVAILLLRGKMSFSGSTFSSVVLVLAGAWILTVGRELTFQLGGPTTGSAIAIGAGVAFAIWSTAVDDIERQIKLNSTRLSFLTYVFFASFVFAITVAYIISRSPALTVADNLILAGNGLRVALVYTLFQLAVRKGGPLLAVVVAVSQVPLTLLWEHRFLSEPISTELIIGVVAITAGAVALLIDEFQTRRPTRVALVNPAV